MIRLNLANVPGLQGEELPTLVDLEGLTPDQPAEPLPEKEMEFVPEQAPAESSEEPVIETKPTLPADEDLFKLAEENLDLIEQAEQEEFIPKPTSPPLDKSGKGPVGIKRHPVLRLAILAVVALLILAAFWGYRQGIFIEEQVTKTAQKTRDKVLEQMTDQMVEPTETTVQKTEDLAEKARLIPDAAQQPGSPISNAVKPVRRMHRYTEPSGISEEYIYRVHIGQNRLQIAAEVLSQFPSNSRLQYLRVKNDKVSFILYVANEQDMLLLKSYFSNKDRFASPEVFFTERTNKVAGNPIEIMAIVGFHTSDCQDTRGYRYFTDRQLSQYVWQTRLTSGVDMQPMKISSKEITAIRNGNIAGNGPVKNIIQLLNELAMVRDNMEFGVISITGTLDNSILEAMLDYNLDTVIYPGNM